MNVPRKEFPSSQDKWNAATYDPCKGKSTWDEAQVEGITQRICNMVAKDSSVEHSLDKLSTSLSTGHRFHVSRIRFN